MLSTWFYTIASVFAVSLISLIGVFTLSVKKEKTKEISILLVSFATGALFGDAFIHLLPEAYEKLGAGLDTSLLVVFGLLAFFVLEKFLRWRHCHIPTSKSHLHPLATMNLIGDAIHNFIDGLLVGASWLVSFPIGFTTTLAIVFHEIPQEIGDFGVLIHAGMSTKKALLFNFLSAVIAILGAVVSLMIGLRAETFAITLLPIAAGGFVYIAGSDLIPELKQDCEATTSFQQLLAIILGLATMVLSVFLE